MKVKLFLICLFVFIKANTQINWTVKTLYADSVKPRKDYINLVPANKIKVNDTLFIDWLNAHIIGSVDTSLFLLLNTEQIQTVNNNGLNFYINGKENGFNIYIPDTTQLNYNNYGFQIQNSGTNQPHFIVTQEYIEAGIQENKGYITLNISPSGYNVIAVQNNPYVYNQLNFDTSSLNLVYYNNDVIKSYYLKDNFYIDDKVFYDAIESPIFYKGCDNIEIGVYNNPWDSINLHVFYDNNKQGIGIGENGYYNIYWRNFDYYNDTSLIVKQSGLYELQIIGKVCGDGCFSEQILLRLWKNSEKIKEFWALDNPYGDYRDNIFRVNFIDNYNSGDVISLKFVLTYGLMNLHFWTFYVSLKKIN